MRRIQKNQDSLSLFLLKAQVRSTTFGTLCHLKLALLLWFPFLAAQANDWPMLQGNPAHSGFVTSIAPQSLQLLWSQKLCSDELVAPIIVTDKIFVTNEKGGVWALNAASGEQIWRHDSAPVKCIPAGSEPLFYLADTKGLLVALETETGKERWRFEIEEGFIGAISLTANNLVLGGLNHFLYGLDPKTGALLWKFKSKSEILGAPTLTNHGWFFTDFKGFAYLLDLQGQKLKQRPLHKLSGLTATANKGSVFLGTLDGSFLRLDLPNLKQSWVFHVPGRAYAFAAPAAQAEDHLLIAGRDQNIRYVNAENGKQIWIFNTSSRLESAPIILGESVFYATQNGDIGLLEVKSGKSLWRTSIQAEFKTSAAMADGRLYMVSSSGTLYCWTGE